MLNDSPKPDPRQAPPAVVEWIRCDRVELKAIDWLWVNRLALGKITLLGGDPAMGKSQIGCAAIATLTASGRWPDGSAAKLGSVIVISAEDGVEDTLAPRLVAANANRARVHCLSRIQENGRDRPFNIQTDMEILARKVEELGDTLLIMIDPLTAFLGSKVDSHRASDVRAALVPLAQFAEQYHVAVLVIAHPNKEPSERAINFIAGSGAFTAAPRLVFLVIVDPDNNHRNLLLPVKNNLGPKAAGLGYVVLPCTVGLEKIDSSYVYFDGQPVKVSADEALEGVREKNRAQARAGAEELLREMLTAGPRTSEEVRKEAAKRGISERTLRRAREEMVEDTKDEFQGPSIWKLKRKH